LGQLVGLNNWKDYGCSAKMFILCQILSLLQHFEATVLQYLLNIFTAHVPAQWHIQLHKATTKQYFFFFTMGCVALSLLFILCHPLAMWKTWTNKR